MSDNVVRVGSRKSALALTQTHSIMARLKELHSDVTFELITMDTIGDKILDVALSKIGDKNLFTKELECALLAKEVDFVVHSLKDMPTSLCSDFVLGCITQRIDKYDVAVFPQNKKGSLDELPAGSVIGTSSVRRVSQLKRRYPNLEFKPIRGNLNTRMKRLDEEGSEFSAIILAKAGLVRLGWPDRVGEELRMDGYAVGQGALAVECRFDDLRTRSLLSSLHDERSALTSICERAMMQTLEGGCSTPLAVDSTMEADVLTLRGLVYSVDGNTKIESTMSQKLPGSELLESGDSILKRQTELYNNGVENHSKLNGGSVNGHGLNHKHQEREQKPSDQIFMGLAVHPICRTAVNRMDVAMRLGQRIADDLLKQGADEILAEIRANSTPTSVPLPAPNESRVQAALAQANAV